jgi:hypothetical protein
MTGRPLAASVGLAFYFAECTKGAYDNLFITFSSRPQIIILIECIGCTPIEMMERIINAERYQYITIAGR